jgi:hypothetical protein
MQVKLFWESHSCNLEYDMNKWFNNNPAYEAKFIQQTETKSNGRNISIFYEESKENKNEN